MHMVDSHYSRSHMKCHQPVLHTLLMIHNIVLHLQYNHLVHKHMLVLHKCLHHIARLPM